MKLSKKEKTQIILDELVKMHDNKKQLDKITALGGLQHRNIAQGAIAGIVRLLMEEMEKQ